ncbi:MAG: metallophosphoesterase [Armatimonadota bacterium]|nr:metallophosphoesterase [Armatimonadota bacterium]
MLALILAYVVPGARGSAAPVATPRAGVTDQKDRSPSGGVNGESFSFAVFGDSRPGSQNLEVLKQIVSELNALGPRFVLHTGDFVGGSKNSAVVEQQYEKFRGVVKDLKAPLHLAIGNHEIVGSRENEALFKRLLNKPRLYYSFSYGNCYFAVLDSEVPGETSRITGSQLAWLEEDLRKNANVTHKFVVVHRPFFPVDGHIGQSLDEYPEDRAKLIALLKRFKVDAVFSGHEHLYNKSVTDGLTEYITGGGGAPLYPSLLGTGSFHHYLLVNVNGKQVSVSVIKPGNVLSADYASRSEARASGSGKSTNESR